MVFHNGGVTKRSPEIAQYFRKDEVRIVLDFSNSSSGSKALPVKFSLRRAGRTIIVRFLIYSGFLSNCDEKDSFTSLKPWVLQIRGHYSYLRIKRATIMKIYTSMNKEREVDPARYFIGVHDRLGDLLSLDSKGPTSSHAVISELHKAIQENPAIGVRVFSDSIEEAKKRLMSVESLADIEYCDQDPKSTIIQLVSSRYFLGTSSKISIWVVIFRNSVDPQGINVMPSNLRENLISNIGTSECISYY